MIVAKPDRMRESLKILLRLVEGLQVVGLASDESAAFAMIAEHRPVLILLDTNLPQDSFLSILKQLSEQGITIHTLVLADNERLGKKALDYGADAMLIKGFSTARLIEVVKSLLSQNSTPGTLGTNRTTIWEYEFDNF